MKWTKLQARRARRTGRKHAAVLAFDVFEGRVLLSTTFTVNDAADTDTGDETSGTLRHVIGLINGGTGDATQNIIQFDIATGLQTITLTGNLDPISKPTVIEGYTQNSNGATPNSAAVGTNASLLVQLDLATFQGLVFSPGATGSVVTGLSIYGGTTAIDVGASNMIVAGNFIGIMADGTSVSSNTTGILVESGATGTTIGGAVTALQAPGQALTALGGRNLISGNTTGISVAAAGASVVGNYFGTDKTGLSPAANATGISISGSTATVGGTGVNAPNVFGTNSTAVALSGNSNTVQSNTFGSTIAAGTLGNTTGIAITSATNLISGNTFGKNTTGVSIAGASATGNQLFGNTVGIGTAGANVGNVTGFLISSPNNSIGGTGAGQGNTIGFNTTGVSISGATATGNRVFGNLLGTNSGLTANLGNVDAIVIDAASNNFVGGSNANEPNTIVNSTNAAVTVTNAGTGNLISRNSIYNNALAIDLTAGGNNALPAPAGLQVTSVPGLTNVQGTLTSTATGANTYTIEFFRSSTGDNTVVPGQAHVYLDSVTVTFNGPGQQLFSKAFPGVTLAPGQVITATAILTATADSNFHANDTSEFAPPAPANTGSFVVTTTDDNGNNTAPIFGSLRAAIVNANANPGVDSILFAIPTTDAGYDPVNNVWVIHPGVALPAATGAVILDGTSQPGYAGVPLIEIDGINTDTTHITGDGLTLGTGSSGSTIKGLSIVNFTIDAANSGAGIHILSGNNVIQNNYLGLQNPSSPTPLGNVVGISIEGGAGNSIGGSAAVGNLITDNTSAGVSISGAAATGNLIRGNSIYNQAALITLVNGGNNKPGQAAPVLTSASSAGGLTNLHGTLSGLAANTTYTIDVYASAVGDSAGTQAHLYLGSFTTLTNGAGGVAFSGTVSASVVAGQTITATVTTLSTATPSNNTSEFSNTVAIANPFLVTTIVDNGDNTNPTPGSLRAAIINANNSVGLDTITFALTPPGSASYIFLVSTNALPTITSPVFIDGTSQAGFAGTPIIVINGQGLAGDGLTLGSGSQGSTIKGLDIVNFAGAGIHILSNGNSIIGNYIGVNPAGGAAGPGNTQQGIFIDGGANNTVGGSLSGSGNVIAFNGDAAVTVKTGAGNPISRNSIFQNGSGIVLDGGNAGQLAPTINTVIASTVTTHIIGTLSGFAANTQYTIEYFASGPGDPLADGQARTFLGSVTHTTDASGNFTLDDTLPVAVPSGQSVTATATSPAKNTSPFSPFKTAVSAFLVTTAADNGDNANPTIGSLRAAIINANAAPGTDTITFAANFTIEVSKVPLPAITDTIVIDGTGKSIIIQPLNNSGDPDNLPAGSNGLVLGTGSSGSTIQGLTIRNFAAIVTPATGSVPGSAVGGIGIVVQSSGNTIGGPGVGNTFDSNGQYGVAVVPNADPTVPVINNIVSANSFIGPIDTTILSPPPVGTDISIPEDLFVNPASNGGIPQPTLVSASVPFYAGPPPATTTLTLLVQAASNALIEVYRIDTNQRTFLGSAALSNYDPTSGQGQLSLSGVAVGENDEIIVTATAPGLGTSIFSTQAAVVFPNVVTNTNDNGSGSLRQAIANATASGADPLLKTITFQIGAIGSIQTIGLTSGPLVVSAGIIIDGLSQGGTGYAGAPLINITQGTLRTGPVTDIDNGLILSDGSSTIQGLAIYGFTKGAGIKIVSTVDPDTGSYIGSVHNTITGNYLGFDAAKVITGKGNLYGLEIDGPTLSASDVATVVGNTITNNQISANLAGGIYLNNGGGNSIQSNLIGSSAFLSTTANQTGNGGDGILLVASKGNTIGGTTAELGNTIDGNVGYGVDITASVTDTTPSAPITASTENVLWLNTIGQSQRKIVATGDPKPTEWVFDAQTLGNLQGGVRILDSTGNTIGGAGSGLGNSIFGNNVDGVLVSFSAGSSGVANQILDNQISFNGGNGIFLDGSKAVGASVPTTVITGNNIGTNPDGTGTVEGLLTVPVSLGDSPTLVGPPLPVVSVGNGKNGILLQDIAASITGNVISGNGISGISASSAPSSVVTTIEGNRIGVDRLGTSTFFIYPQITPTFGYDSDERIVPVSYSAAPVNSSSDDYRMGNVLDGILLDNSSGVSISGGNVISGNLGRGIEVRGGGVNTIGGNFIGVGVGGTSVTDQNTKSQPQTQTLGNLGDGIFLLDVHAGDIFIGNVISGNRGYGLHARSSSALDQIVGNFIGTNSGGNAAKDASKNGFGNNADGIFFDLVTDSTIGGPTGTAPNVISNNSANGINLLDSNAIIVRGNLIGTAGDGYGVYSDGNPVSFGNSGNGIFVNQSTNNQIGGTSSGQRNIISGNLASGIVISGSASDPSTAGGNRIEGNYIGLDIHGGPLANEVSGIVIIAASGNSIGGTGAGARNVISGNRLYGVELTAGSTGNAIAGNFIGTDIGGSTSSVEIVDRNNKPVLDSKGNPLVLSTGNTSDGVFLINSSNNLIGGTAPGAGNAISGNFANGVRIFGRGSTGNLIAGNLIGLGGDGESPIPNLGNGILFDNVASGNNIGDGSAGGRNIISGNIQSGVMIVDSSGAGGSTIRGNYIGTNRDGSSAVGNGANGILIFGSAGNAIGGITAIPGTGFGNVISGNLQSGIFLYSAAAGAQANDNQIQGNEIGTDAAGTHAIANNADGVQIVNGNDNTIGGTAYGAGNIISGNLASGINITAISDSQNPIARLTAQGNLIIHNVIGLSANGIDPLGGSVQQNGVVIQDASLNIIGSENVANMANTNVPMPGLAANVISGNLNYGVLLNGASQANAIKGNYIGVDKYARQGDHVGNGLGVFINSTTALGGENTVGGTADGAGNIISGNTGVGVELYGPTSGVQSHNFVLGNVIGLGLAYNGSTPVGWIAASNLHGVSIQSSAGNFIGGTTPAERNVISGNGDSGVLITGAGSIQNLVRGNYIGVDPAGGASIYTGNAPTQQNGVQIAGDGAYQNTIGSGGSFADPGANVISGNQIGVAVNNVGLPNNGAGKPDSTQRNLIQGNLVGVTPGGSGAAGNSQYGILANNAPYTVILGNLTSANGIGGVGIIANQQTFVTVDSNIIGPGADGGIPGAQPNGVVIIGASSNVIGGAGAGNLIKGNTSVGIYISKQDFNGVNYATPVDNAVRYNTVASNKTYGILFYNAPNNVAPPFTDPGRNRNARRRRPGSNANIVVGNGVSFLNFVTRVNRNNSLRKSPKAKVVAHPQAHAKLKTPAHPQAKPLRVIMPKHR